MLARHPCRKKMNDTVHQEYYWPRLVNDAYKIVKDFQTCPKEGTSHCHQRHLKLLPTTGLLAFFAIDITGPFTKSAQYDQSVAIISNRYLKPTRALPTAKVSVLHVMLIFLNH